MVLFCKFTHTHTPEPNKKLKHIFNYILYIVLFNVIVFTKLCNITWCINILNIIVSLIGSQISIRVKSHGNYFPTQCCVWHWRSEVMEEQSGSPGVNTDNSSQRNGDEVSRSCDRWPRRSLYRSLAVNEDRNNVLAETSQEQLDQRQEKEEAAERQQRPKSSANRVRPVHERAPRAAEGGKTRRAVPRDHQDARERVEQAAPGGETGQDAHVVPQK